MSALHKATFVCVLLVGFLCACTPQGNTSKRMHDGEGLTTIPLELTTHLGDRQEFIEGDEIQFLLSLADEAYIYMYYVDARGNIKQLLPNPSQADNHYRAGYFMTIPEYEDHFRFIVRPPYGDESVYVFASDADIDPMRAADGHANDIESLRDSIISASGAAFGEAVLTLRTSEAVKKQ